MAAPEHRHRPFTLLTGATGQIGRYLLRDMLLADQSVAVLVRDSANLSAKDRVEQIMIEWERQLQRPLPRPVCLSGDTTQDAFGMTRSDFDWVAANCGTLLHNAASVSFGRGVNPGETYDTNVSGARRTIEMCRRAKFDHLAYVSTAYICGKTDRLVKEEELIEGSDFRNEYEESKFVAERMVREQHGARTLTVLRPGIVVGDSRTGQTHSFHGFFRTVQVAHLISSWTPRREDGTVEGEVRLNLSGDEGRNFVHVDWVSAAMLEILADDRWHGRTYHLTPKRPTTTGEIFEALRQYFDLHGVRFVGRVDLPRDEMTAEEKTFYDFLGEYNDYWSDDPNFDRIHTDEATANVPEPRVDAPSLLRMIDYAVVNEFGKRRGKRTAAMVEPDLASDLSGTVR